MEIPSEVWAQYPLLFMGVVLVAWLARYWIGNEKEWRAFVVEQLKQREGDQLRVLQLVQTNSEQQLKLLGENHKDLVAMVEEKHREQMEMLRETADTELERVLEALVKK